MATTLFPAYYSLSAPPALPATLPPARQQRPRLAPECWPEIAARAEQESLRALALAYGVSHETIRAIVRRARPPKRPALMVAD
jgi:hypothetical protein